MYVYLIAFTITLLFVYKTKVYYKKYRCCINQNFNINFNDKKSNVKTKYKIYTKVCAVLSFLPLFLVSAFRYGVGTDFFHTYVPAFDEILLYGKSPFAEKGFTLLINFIQLFTDNSQWLFIITSFIFVAVLIYCVLKYSEIPCLSIIVVFLSGIYFVSLNNVRQAISAIIILASFPYIMKGDALKFLTFELFACMFHYAALLMLVPYILIRIKFVRRNFLFCSIVILIFSPILCILLKYLLSLTKYSYFLTDYFDDNIAEFSILINLILFVISYVVLKNQIKTDDKSYVLLVIQFILFTIFWMSIFLKISELISRIAFMFQVFQVFLIPHLYKRIKLNSNKLLFIIFILLIYGFNFFYFIMLKGAHDILPYKWIFNV